MKKIVSVLGFMLLCVALLVPSAFAATDITEADLAQFKEPGPEVKLITAANLEKGPDGAYHFGQGFSLRLSLALEGAYKVITFSKDEEGVAWWYNTDDDVVFRLADTLDDALSLSVALDGTKETCVYNDVDAYVLFFPEDANSLEDVEYVCKLGNLLNHVVGDDKPVIPAGLVVSTSLVSTELDDDGNVVKAIYRLRHKSVKPLDGYTAEEEHVLTAMIEDLGIAFSCDTDDYTEFEVPYPTNGEYIGTAYTDLGNKLTFKLAVNFDSTKPSVDKPTDEEPVISDTEHRDLNTAVPVVNIIGLPDKGEHGRMESLIITIETANVPTQLSFDGVLVSEEYTNTHSVAVNEDGTYYYIVVTEAGQSVDGTFEVSCFAFEDDDVTDKSASTVPANTENPDDKDLTQDVNSDGDLVQTGIEYSSSFVYAMIFGLCLVAAGVVLIILKKRSVVK